MNFLENKNGWHGKVLDEEQLQRALKEIPNPEIPSINIKKPLIIKQKIKIQKKIKFADYNLGEEIATRESYGDALGVLSEIDSNVLEIGRASCRERV